MSVPPPPSRPGPVSRREARGVGPGGVDVGVAGEHPEPLVAGRVRRRRVEPDRRVAPQRGEELVREAVGEAVEVGEVDLLEPHRR